MTTVRSSRSQACRHPESGISLVEVMVAVVVITVGILALGAVIPTGINRVTDSESETKASALCAERCEALLITPYDHEDLDVGAHASDQNPVVGLYNVEWTVEVDQPVVDCKRITVTVERAANNLQLSRLVIVVPRSNG
jgi:type IV pilus assembly protein PilV